MLTKVDVVNKNIINGGEGLCASTNTGHWYISGHVV